MSYNVPCDVMSCRTFQRHVTSCHPTKDCCFLPTSRGVVLYNSSQFPLVSLNTGKKFLDLGGVYMMPGRLLFRREFTPVLCLGSVFVYMIPPENVILRVRISPREEIFMNEE